MGDKIKKYKKDFEINAANALLIYFIYLFLRYLVSPLIQKIWIHKVEGLENIPKNGPIIVASNHESYFDFICFWAISPRQVQYLAAEKFFNSKFWKPFMIATGQIKVERNKKDKTEVHQKAHYILKNEGMLGIFPEGTRSRNGELGKAYTGVAKFAIEGKVPVVPVGIIGTFDILPPHKKMPKFKKCRIIIEKPIHFKNHYDKELTEETLRHLTDNLMEIIARLIGKEYKHQYNYKNKKTSEKK